MGEVPLHASIANPKMQDVKKAQAATRKAQEELKKSEEAASETTQRLSEIEKRSHPAFTTHKMSIKSFGKSRFPHESVN